MQKTILAAALVVLVGTPAFAQGGSTTVQKNAPDTVQRISPDSRLLEAPIGHRQPRASDVPDERTLADPNDPLAKENSALDRKIKSICRGC
jgi:hypothetical protein